jgi:hypothetical protein
MIARVKPEAFGEVVDEHVWRAVAVDDDQRQFERGRLFGHLSVPERVAALRRAQCSVRS